MNRVMQVLLTANNTNLTSVLTRSAAEVQAFSRMATAGNTAVAASADKATVSHKAQAAGIQTLSTVALGLGVAMAAGIGLAVSKFAEFDQAMSQVEAATHASAETMDLLRQAAIDAGASTVFSATEAAQGITALAKAGVEARDILGGGLAGALDLAAAGELDVGSAAEIAATAMTQFTLAGSEVPHIADLLAAAAGKAQGEVTDMAAALNQSGLVAAQMGLSIEETTGTLAAFASAGLLGSDAGTSFRTMLLRLANPTEEAKDLMAGLGISAYDAQGQFVGMEDLAGQLRSTLGGLTQQQRDSTLATLFGSDAIRGANVLYNQGAGGIEKWTANVNDQGFAAETAAIKTDNLVGDIERLGGALDSALIGAGSAANDTLRVLAQAMTGVVDSFAALPGPLQAVLVGMGAVTAAVALAAGAYGLAGPAISRVNLALIATGPAGAAASRGLTTAAKAAGLLGAAWIAVDLGGSQFQKWTGDVVAGGEPAADTLLQIASSGDITNASMEALGATSYSFRDAMDAAFNRNILENGVAFFNQLGSLGGNLPWGDDAADEASRFFASVDNGLVSLVNSGRTQEAAAVFEVIAVEAARSGATVADVARGLPQYADLIEKSMEGASKALAEAVESGSAEDLAAAITTAQQAIELGGLSAEEAAAKFPQLADAMQILALIAPDLSNQAAGVAISILDVGLAAEQVDTRLDALKLAMDQLTGGAITAQQAQANFTLSLQGLAEALAANGTSFDVNTVAGANNYNQLASVAGQASETALALYEQAAASGNSAAGYDAFTGSLYASRQALSDTLFAMTGNRAEADALAASIIAIPTQKDVDIMLNANTGAAEAALNYASRDRTSYVNQIVSQSGAYSLNTGQRYGGIIEGMAAGGQIRGPGTGTSDSILATVTGGGRLRVSNGEYVVNAEDTARNRPELDAANFSHAKLMIAPGYAAGGALPAGASASPLMTRSYSLWGTGGAGGGFDGALAAEIRGLRAEMAAFADRPFEGTFVTNLDGRPIAESTNKFNREARGRNGNSANSIAYLSDIARPARR